MGYVHSDLLQTLLPLDINAQFYRKSLYNSMYNVYYYVCYTLEIWYYNFYLGYFKV